MKRGFRLSGPAEIKRVRRLGKSLAHPFLVLIVLPNEIGQVRVAVVAGSAVGGAVQRNRAKRVLRAAIEPLLGHIASGHDIVLIARADISGAKAPQAEVAIGDLLQKAILMK